MYTYSHDIQRHLPIGDVYEFSNNFVYYEVWLLELWKFIIEVWVLSEDNQNSGEDNILFRFATLFILIINVVLSFNIETLKNKIKWNRLIQI